MTLTRQRATALLAAAGLSWRSPAAEIFDALAEGITTESRSSLSFDKLEAQVTELIERHAARRLTDEPTQPTEKS